MTHLHQAQHAQRTSRVPRFGVAAITVAVSAALGGFAEPAAAAGGFNYGVIAYTDIADTFTGSPYSQIYLEPSINNAGQVAFSVLTQANISTSTSRLWPATRSSTLPTRPTGSPAPITSR